MWFLFHSTKLSKNIHHWRIAQNTTPCRSTWVQCSVHDLWINQCLGPENYLMPNIQLCISPHIANTTVVFAIPNWETSAVLPPQLPCMIFAALLSLVITCSRLFRRNVKVSIPIPPPGCLRVRETYCLLASPFCRASFSSLAQGRGVVVRSTPHQHLKQVTCGIGGCKSWHRTKGYTKERFSGTALWYRRPVHWTVDGTN